jgi:iron complex outermembrane receptor protein
MTVRETVEGDYSVSTASTGTKTNTPSLETPLNIQVVTQQALIDEQVTRIDQALRNVSGIAFTAGGDTSFGNPFDAVVLRGFQTDSHLRNGVRIDSAGGDTELYTQQLANVESVEVLKGPAAILYGAVEPGGVVNIVTKQPQATPSYSIGQQFGSYDMFRTTIDATGPVNSADTLLYRLDGSYDTGNSIVNLGFHRDLFVAPTFKLLLGESAQVTLEYEHKDANFNGNYAIFPLVEAPSGQFVPLFDNPSLNFGERSTMREQTDLAGLLWSYQLASDWAIKQQFLANLVHSTAPQVTTYDGIGPSDPNNPASAPAVYRVMAPFNTHDETYATYLDLTGHFSTGPVKHTLLLGGDWYRFNSTYVLTNSNPTFAFDPTVDSLISLFNPVHPGTAFGALQPYIAGTGPQVSWGLYLQDQVALPDGWFVVTGVRYQHVFNANYFGETLASLTSSPISGDKLTPRVGLLWQPANWVSLYANFAENWGPSNGAPITGGGLAPPTGATQYELGIKFATTDGRLSSTIAVYDLTKTNIPTPDPNNPGFDLVTGKVRSKGLEVDLQGELARGWNLILNFSDIDARILVSNDSGNPPGTQWPETPRIIANLWTTYDTAPGADEGLRLGAGVNAQGSTPPLNYTGVLAAHTSDYAQLPGVATLNVMAAYRFTTAGMRWALQVNASNLLDRRYFSYISLNDPQPGSTYAYAGNVYSYDRRLYGDPRTILGEITVQF